MIIFTNSKNNFKRIDVSNFTISINMMININVETKISYVV